MNNVQQLVMSKLQEMNVSACVWTFVEDLAVDLFWEDWKTHVAVKNLLSDLFGYDKWDVVVTENDGSDCYSARYAVSGVVGGVL